MLKINTDIVNKQSKSFLLMVLRDTLEKTGTVENGSKSPQTDSLEQAQWCLLALVKTSAICIKTISLEQMKEIQEGE